MPATESTWRDTKALHRVFAISGIILTLATVWMFYKDHARPWKAIQPKVVNIDLKMNRWRQEQFATTDAVLEHSRLSSLLTAAAARPVDPNLLNEFKRTMQDGATTPVSTTAIDNQAKRQAELAATAAEKRAAAEAARAAAEAKPEDASLADAAARAEREALAVEQRAGDARRRLVNTLESVVDEAKTNEDKALGLRKFKSADIDAARANVDIAVRDNLPQEERDRREKIVKELTEGKGGLNELNQNYEALAAHRKELDKIVKQITAEVDAAQKAYDESRGDLERLKTQYEEKEETYFTSSFPFLGKKFLTLPILDAFSSPRKIENLWSDDLEQDYSHRKVRRFDRCTTCHQSIQKTMPGQPTTPAYVKAELLEMMVVPPAADALPPPRRDRNGQPLPPTLEDLLGLRLAAEGLLERDDVTVSLVLPNSPGAKAQLIDEDGAPRVLPGAQIRLNVARLSGPPGSAQNDYPLLPGLLVGDVITQINGEPLFGGNRGPKRVGATLRTLALEGRPIRLQVRRGLPSPFTSHPRLDLYVSDSSPHRMQVFGCTICHEGQGSATEFKWASHTPNTTLEAARWTDEYGWFDNPHWIYPMYAQRFAEASCLKCHHQVVELEPSARFPDAPAPKVVHGYHLIRKYGCYGCHEINGFDGPDRRIGPDLRLEPNFFAAAQALMPLLESRAREIQGSAAPEPPASDIQPREKLREASRLATRLASRPDLDGVRHELLQLIEEDARLAEANKLKPEAEQLPTAFGPKIHAIAPMLRDVEAPGELRKPGPSLRYVAAKLDRVFLYDWIRDPTQFRPNTRMPKFFGLWDHLKDEEGHMTDSLAPRLEPVEIRGMVEYLLAQSQDRMGQDSVGQDRGGQPGENRNTEGGVDLQQLASLYEPLERPSGIDEWTDDEKIARGKVQFETRGCLACHTHKDFPDVSKYRAPDEIVQGPDLSGVSGKFGSDHNPVGPDWLYSWIKEPTRYHARTLMPNVFLEPETTGDGKKFDPADDIATYLLASSKNGWSPVPAAEAAAKPLDEQGTKALNDLVLEYLNEAFYKEDAKKYLEKGIPPEMEGELKGAEKDLIQQPGQTRLTDAQKLHYIGRRSISKYGCFGCHDIPGFEDSKPIGTGLADWGRKDPARLAFEHITHYLEGHHIAHGPGGHENPPRLTNPDHPTSPASTGKGEAELAAEVRAIQEAVESSETPEIASFYHHAIEAGNRIGFAYQKLKEPRSYDYEKTEYKRYNERLRMPQFPFDADEREAIVTFVIGLVADPPRDKYLYSPDPREGAIAAGRQVLEKYNCGGCHILQEEKWKISYTPGEYGPQSESNVYPFLRPHFSPLELAAQANPNRRNQLHSELSGLPTLAKPDGLPFVADAEGLELDPSEPYSTGEIRLAMDLWRPTIIDGNTYMTGQSPITAPSQQIEARYPTLGGALTKYLLPRVTMLEKQANPNASGSEAYGWLPPPLIGEGEKVQSAWLHSFLLEPYPIRPAVFLRMPRFNMSSAEATTLVNYFSAMDNAEYPYEFSPQQLESEMAEKAREYASALDRSNVEGADAEGGFTALNSEEQIRRRYDDAMQIVVNGNYCVKCHRVADFEPQGSPRAKAPNLADVYRRLRPEYMRDWIANPKMFLPYTPMPVNIPYDPNAPHLGGVSQDLYHGTSIEQVQAIVDLLANYDRFARRSQRIADMVKPAPAPAEGAPPAEGTPPATGTTGSSGE